MNKINSSKQFFSLVIGACIMSFITSCNEDHVESSRGSKNEPIEEMGIEGKYEVRFSSLNSSVGGFVMARAKIHVIADQISVGVDVKDSPASTTHSQFIYTASECPTELNDTNSDGFIDPQEAAKVLGSVLVPLDGDLNSQEEGANVFPRANTIGDYSYYQEGVLSRLISDLRTPDMNARDEMVKLHESENLKLEGKVMILKGVADSSYLPGSIRVLPGDSDRASLPIACGRIARIIQIEDTEFGSQF